MVSLPSELPGKPLRSPNPMPKLCLILDFWSPLWSSPQTCYSLCLPWPASAFTGGRLAVRPSQDTHTSMTISSVGRRQEATGTKPCGQRRWVWGWEEGILLWKRCKMEHGKVFGQLCVGGFAWNIAVGNTEEMLERELRIPWMEASGCPVKVLRSKDTTELTLSL